MAEQDEHAGDVRRLSSIALALTAGGHKAEAGSHSRSRSRVPSAKRAQHARRLPGRVPQGRKNGTTDDYKVIS